MNSSPKRSRGTPGAPNPVRRVSALAGLERTSRGERIAHRKAAVYHWEDVVAVSNFLDIPVKEVGKVLHIAPATLSRRRDKNLNADESDRFYRLDRIRELAITVLDDADKAAHWIQSEIPSLGGERPIDLVGTTKGYEDVINVLNAIEYGIVT